MGLRQLLSDEKKYKILTNTIILAISLVAFSKKGTVIKEVSPFENFLIDTFAPLQEGIISLNRVLKSTVDHYLANVDAAKKVVVLEKDMSELRSQVFQLEQVAKENERLKDLLDFGRDIKLKKILAQIVSWDAGSDFKIIRVNKGHLSGVRLQSPVVTADGLVGYIYRLTDNYADILTILDSSMRVDAMVERIRAHGIVEGVSTTNVQMKYVTRTEPVTLGDVVISSGLGNVFPKGIRIGSVSKVERESYGITQFIEIEPSVDFGTIEEVVILVSDLSPEKIKELQVLDSENEGSLK